MAKNMKNNSYINQNKLPYPFCPGCSHGLILNKLNEAMSDLGLKKDKVVIVTDIGCVGLSDQWFTTHAFHGLHGRSVLYGQGLKLSSPDLHVIVLMGDGGAGIGGHHLIHAARRNIGITTLVFNNFNFGMTGGQQSVLTPEGASTSTTIYGNIERPMKLAETILLNGAGFVSRRAFYDKDLLEILKEAIKFNGFSFIEILEFCTAYYQPNNNFKKNDMEELITQKELPRILEIDESLKEYNDVYMALGKDEIKENSGIQITQNYKNNLNDDLTIIIAGSAGQKIRSTANNFAQSAIASGLFVIQRDDYPVTVKSGHSVSFLKLSNKQLRNPMVDKPDIIIILSKDGLSKVEKYLKNMNSGDKVYIQGDLSINTKASVFRIHLPEEIKITDNYITSVMLHSFIEHSNIFQTKAFLEFINSSFDKLETEKIYKYFNEVKID